MNQSGRRSPHRQSLTRFCPRNHGELLAGFSSARLRYSYLARSGQVNPVVTKLDVAPSECRHSLSATTFTAPLPGQHLLDWIGRRSEHPLVAQPARGAMLHWTDEEGQEAG